MADRSLTLGTLFTANVESFLRGVDRMRTSLRGMNQEFARASGGTTKGFQGMGRAADTATKAAAKTTFTMGQLAGGLGKVTGALDRVGKAFKIITAFGIAGAVIFSMVRALQAGAKEIVDYDQALKNLQAITRATDAEVAGMGETIKDVARKTKFSTGEVAEGMVLLGQAGFTAAEAMNSMQAVADLATGTLSDMRLTTDLLTTTIRAFSLDSTESARAADVMANAINKSKLTVDKLRVAFNFVGAAAHQTGLELEETAAALGVLANNGIRASTMGTGLRQVLARLLAPNRRLREAFQEHGVALEKINPRIVGFQQSMKELVKILFDTEKQVVDMGKTYTLFGLRGAQAAAILVKEFVSGGYAQMLENVSRTGTAAEMAAKQMEGLGVKLKNLADRAKLVAVAFGEAGITGALKVIVDVLREFALIIADLVSSKLGRFLVMAGLIGGAFAGLIKGVQLLIFLYGKLITKVVALNAAWGVAALANPWTAVAAALGVLVGTIAHYVRESKRAVEAMEKTVQESENVAQSLRVYMGALESLIKKKEENKKIDDEYFRVLNRLKIDHPEVAKKINESTDAIKENIEALKEAHSAELHANIKRSTELIRQYNDEIERTKFLAGIWERLSTLGDLIVKGFGKAVAFVVKELLGLLADTLRLLQDMLLPVSIFGNFFKDNMEKAATSLEGLSDRAVEYFKKFGEGSSSVEGAMDRQTAAMVRMAKAMKETGDSTDIIVAKLRELGATDKQVARVTQELEKQRIGISEMAGAVEDQLSKLPEVWEKYYKSLDPLRQADFSKILDRIDKEITAYEARAERLKHSDEDVAAARASIRARELIKFISDNEKELLAEGDLNDRKIDALNEFIKEYRIQYDELTKDILNRYFRELEAAEDNNEKLIEAEEKKNKALLNANDIYQAQLFGVKTTFNADLVAQERELVDEMNKAHSKLVKDLVSQLKAQYRELEGEVNKLTKMLKDVDRDYHESLRELRQKTMTDEEKWYNDRKTLNDLLNKAIATEDFELFKTIKNLATGLSREVVDENGKAVLSLEETTRAAQRKLKEIWIAERTLIKNQIADRKKSMRELKLDIQELTNLIDNYKRAIDDASRRKLELQTEEAISKLQRTYNITSKFKDVWDKLKSKTITLTVRIKKEGGGELEESGAGEGEPVPKLQRGGFVKRGGLAKVDSAEVIAPMNSLKNMLKDLLGDMTIGARDTMSQAFANLRGFTGPGLRSTLQTGTPALAMQPAPVYNLHLNAGILSGDKMQMREVAETFKREIDAINRRWGT